MSTTIRRGDDQRLHLHLQSTSGMPAMLMAWRAFGTQNLRITPAELIDPATVQSDIVVVCQQGTAAASALRRMGLRCPSLKAGAYHIRTLSLSAGKCLAVVGGDIFGMLAGWADVLRYGSLDSTSWIYRGEDRTETPAFPIRYYWTWDHSTNWVLDDEGNQASGCNNGYFKKPETFVEDYRRVIDHCVESRINGVVVWGFLRDVHGGEAYAGQVATYAADRGVVLMPGVGTTGYGGVYYQGQHPCNLETFLRAHPELGHTNAQGGQSGAEISPYHRKSQEWIAQSIEWLLNTFPGVGGVNLENMDFLVDHSPAGKRGRAKLKGKEGDVFKDQFVAYKTALEVTQRLRPEGWNCYATYAGFNPKTVKPGSGLELDEVPRFARELPEGSVGQWTLSAMVREQPIAIHDWLDTPRPKLLYDNPLWPKGLKPPTKRSVGFLHQASPWCPTGRNSCMVSTFAEGCVRAYEEGFEGMSVHGEISSRVLSYDLNYLAMRHWTYHPHSSFREFADAELTPRLGGAQEAQRYVEALAHLQKGDHAALKETIAAAKRPGVDRNATPADLRIARLWVGLNEWSSTNKFPYWGRGHIDFY